MIYRANKDNNNSVEISNDFINDINLTPTAKGVMLYLMSQPDDYKYDINEISKYFYDKNAVIKGIKELIDKGYIERKKIRNEKGQFTYDYTIYETLKIKE